MVNPEHYTEGDGRKPSIELAGKGKNLRLQGFGGVNNFTAPLRLKDHHWEAGPLGRTRMAGPALDYENLLLNYLAESNRYILYDNFLFLYRDSMALLILGIPEEEG